MDKVNVGVGKHGDKYIASLAEDQCDEYGDSPEEALGRLLLTLHVQSITLAPGTTTTE